MAYVWSSWSSPLLPARSNEQSCSQLPMMYHSGTVGLPITPWKTTLITRSQRVLPTVCIAMSSMTIQGREPNDPDADLARQGPSGKQVSSVLDKEEKQNAHRPSSFMDSSPFIPDEFRMKTPSEMSDEERIGEVRMQLEYYFSPLNIVHDKFMKNTMRQGDFAVPTQVLATFSNIKFLGATFEDIKKAAETSDRLIWVDPALPASLQGLGKEKGDEGVVKPAKRGRKPKSIETADTPLSPVPASEGFIAPSTPYKSLEATNVFNADKSIVLYPVHPLIPTSSLAKFVRSLLQGQDFRIVRQPAGSNQQSRRLNCILEFMTAEERNAVLNSMSQLTPEKRLGIKSLFPGEEWTELQKKRYMESRKIVLIGPIQKNLDPNVMYRYIKSILGVDAYRTRIDAQNGSALVLVSNGASALKLVELLEAQFTSLRQMSPKDLEESELGALFKTIAAAQILRNKGFRREIVLMEEFIAERRKARMENREDAREVRRNPKKDV